MDIRTLPKPQRKIYNRLRKKYSLTFDRLTVGDKKLRLLRPADLEQYLDGKDPYADVSEFPFWVRLWDAAMILAYILGQQTPARGKTLLELGAGLAAPGLAAAAAGYTVTLSDQEELILDFQRVSAAASKIEGVEFLLMDWQNPPSLQPYEVIIGAEILFKEDSIEPLLEVFNRYLADDGVIYLAHDRKRQSLAKFLQIAQDDYDIGLKKQNITRDGREATVIINRLRRKKKA